jgi:hypothetical protein
MNAISAYAQRVDGLNSILSPSSAVPAFVLFGRSFWSSWSSVEFPSIQDHHFVNPTIQISSGTVTVASDLATPRREDWLQTSVEVAPARAAALAALWDRIVRSVQKAVAQADDEATAVSEETIEYTRRLLGDLPKVIEFPQVTVSSDGEIIFTWFRSDNRMEAILAPDHHLTWVFRLDGKVIDGDVIALSDSGSLSTFYKAVTDFYE